MVAHLPTSYCPRYMFKNFSFDFFVFLFNGYLLDLFAKYPASQFG